MMHVIIYHRTGSLIKRDKCTELHMKVSTEYKIRIMNNKLHLKKIILYIQINTSSIIIK